MAQLFTCVSTTTIVCLCAKVFHPLKGEHLTTGAVATVAWGARAEWGKAEGNKTEDVDLWLIVAEGEEMLVARGIGSNCPVRNIGMKQCIQKLRYT